MLCLSSTTLAAKPQSNSPGPGQASPLVSPVPTLQPPAGNDTINITPGMPEFNGHGKLGNLHNAPALIKNVTQKVKQQVNDARLNQAKAMAEVKINVIINQLMLYEKWVDNSGIDRDQKADIKAIVDSNILWFRQQSEDIGAATDLATVQSLSDEADQQAATLRVSIKKEAGIMACDRLDDRIATARNASAGIADRIAALKATGNNTATAEQKLADYNAHINAAAAYSSAARDSFEGISGVNNMDRDFNEGYRQIAQADREMTQAYVDLKSVYLWYLQASRQAR